jgi:hypothetical protein
MSKSGTPISWFHTTMFDVEGLPKNQDGNSVFKMSYNNNTEPNVCYDVKGDAYVRFAKHPYNNQQWSQWYKLDQDTTYYLDETIEFAEWVDLKGEKHPLRNKHEISIDNNGYVSLYCIFDPAVTGVEKHSVGEYSQYPFLREILGSDDYAQYQQQTQEYDQMINNLSLLQAKNLNYKDSQYWHKYQQGKKSQHDYEKSLYKSLSEQKTNRENVIANWINAY